MHATGRHHRHALFGAQSRDPIYATYDVEALHTGKPNTVASLKAIPM